MEKTISGLKITYQLSGQGRDVLLLHGWGVDAAVMEPLRLHLAENARAVSLDMPGFGDSHAPSEVWGVSEYADFVESFIDELGLVQPVIIGHSFGGRLAIILGARGKASKLILADSAGVLPKRGFDYYFRIYSYKLAKKLFSLPGLRDYADQVMALWLDNNPSSDYVAAEGIMRKIFVKVVNEDLQHLLPQINVPALLIWGENDTATPLADGKLMESRIPDAGLVVFPGAGHYSFLDDPSRFNIIADYFLHNEE